MVFSVDDVHKLQPQASSEHLRVLAGCARRLTGSDARSQLGHARAKKKQKNNLFSQHALLPGLQPECISSSHSLVCMMTPRARLQLALGFYGQGAATTHGPSRLAGRRRRVKNYEHVHSGRCFSESLEQILVDELMSVSYITVVAQLI